jgi:phenylacetate-CoA ligase
MLLIMNLFHQNLFLWGQKLRNPSLSKVFKELKQTEKLTRVQLESLQLEKLKAILHHAYTYSTFYKNTFDKAGVHPKDLETLSDISKFPSITKSDLIRFNEEIHTTKAIKYPKLFKANTSGSTGQSLHFLRDEYTDSFNRASIFRGYSWYNVKPWEYNIYFWGFNFSRLKKLKTKLMDTLVNRFRLFSYLEKDFIKMIHQLEKAYYISGYSSMIYQTAKLINEKKYPKPKNLKMVKGTSEKIYESYQEEVQKAFGLKMISEYGAAETGIIAFECPAGQMHINTEGVVIETNEESEIIVTNLITKSFPVIRYKLGDYVKLDLNFKTCSCGLNHPILEEVTGRIGDIIYGKDYIYPSLYFYYIFKNLDKEQQITLTYQVFQEKKGELIFAIKEPMQESQIEKLKVEIIKYFNNDITFIIKPNEPMIYGRTSKMKSFISKLTINK